MKKLNLGYNTTPPPAQTTYSCLIVKAMIMIVLGIFTHSLDGQNYSPPTNIIDSLARFYAPTNNNTPSTNGEEGDYEFMERELKMWSSRLYGSNGDFTEALAAYQDYATTFGAGASCAQGSTPQTNTWKSIGPKTYTGQIHNIVFDPHFNEVNHPDNQTIYACAPYGGLWRTVNGGTLWEQVNTDNQLPIASVIDMCIDPTNNNTLFVATGLAIETEYFSPYRLGNLPIFTGGVYRSTNKGLTWEAINDGLLSNLDLGALSDIVMNPENANEIFLATTEGIFRTQNALAATPTWTQFFTGDYNDDFFALEFKYKIQPTDPQILEAAGTSFYTCDLSTGFWTNISQYNGDPLGIMGISTTDEYILRTNLAVTPYSGYTNKIFTHVTTKSKSTGLVNKRVFYYDFINNNWIWLERSAYTSQPGFQYNYKMNDIAVSPTNPEHVSWAGIYLSLAYQSFFNNFGTPILNQSLPFTYFDIRCIAFEPNVSIGTLPRLFVGNDDGVFYIEGYNVETPQPTATKINTGLDIDMVIALDDSEHDREVILAGFQDHHTFGKHLNPATQNYEWTDVGVGGDGYRASIDDATGKYFYFAANDAEFTDFVNKDGTILINDAANATNPTDPYLQNAIGTIYMINHPQTDKMIWGSLEMQSRNYPIAGANTAAALWDVESDIWQNYGDPNSPTTPFPFDKRGVIRKMAISPSNPEVVYVALGGEYASDPAGLFLDYPPRLFKSTAGLCNDISPTLPSPKFIDITNNLPTFGPQNKVYCISDIVIDPNNPDKIWIGFLSYQQSYKIFKSVDGGLIWTNDDPNNSLCNLPINTMAYQDGSNDRIFLGMDNGVFYKNAGMTDWERYGNELPNIRITSMKINSCAGIMRVGTWGRGIWEVDLPYNDRLQTEKLLTQDETWQPELIYNPDPNSTTDDVYQTEKALRSNLRIQAGVTLTIKDFTVGMPKYGMIYVEPGAKLIVDNSTLTNLCGEMWGGIEVMGNVAFPQEPDANGNYLQGYVHISNNSVVEHAHTAISTDYLYGSGQWGGIIQASHSEFRNNQRSAVFMQYHNADFLGNPLPNRSYFSNCPFFINNDYRGDEENVPFKAHITAWNIEGLAIKSCDLENNKTTNMGYAQSLGTGIYTIDAGFSVKGHCNYSNVPAPGTNPPCPFEDIEPSVFKGLFCGIRADKESSINTFTVHGCRFENNIRGIESNGVDFPTMLQNKFLVGGNPYPIQGSFTHEGLVVNKGIGYQIEENRMVMQPTTGTFRWTVGTRINSTGAAANQVYNNDYEGLFVGELSNGNNYGGSIGLQFLCNTHTDDYADIAVVNTGGASGIRKEQGNLNSPYDAGNSFSQNGNFNQGDYSNDAQSFNYYYKLGTLNDPLYYTTSTITKIQKLDKNECSSNIDFGLGEPQITTSEIIEKKQQFYVSQTAYLSLFYTYQQLIDGGNTNALVQNITQTWSDDAWTLRNQLISRSPYLSEEALRSAISEDVLPQAMVFEICLANPDVLRSDDFLVFLSTEISNPLPEYMMISLKNARITGSVRTVLENGMMQKHTEMAETAYPIIRQMLNDSLAPNPDSLMLWVGNLQTLPSQYILADLYYERGQGANAVQTLAQIPTLYKLNEEDSVEHENYVDLMNFRLAIRESNRNLSQLTEAEKTSLIAIRDASDKMSGVLASNTLCFHYGICKDYPAVLPQTVAPRKAAPAISQLLVGLISLKAYPNPAQDFVTFDYELMSDITDAYIEISDISGKIVSILPCKEAKMQLLWNTQNISAGIYLYACKRGSSTLAVGKIAIQH